MSIIKNNPTQGLLLLLIMASLGACSYNYKPMGRYEIENDGPDHSSKKNPSTVKNAKPKWEPKSKYGNPSSYEVYGKRYYVLGSSQGYKKRGIASWYGKKFHGKRTSSGETYDMYAMTAAHKTLPLPTYAKVTNLHNRRHVIVKINDRGPFHDNRLIDLSYTAASQLGIVAKGTGLVEVEAINPATWQGDKASIATQYPSSTSEKSSLPTSNSQSPVNIFIQVGAFASVYNAQNLVKKLRSYSNQAVFINHSMVKGKRFSRVRIGPLNTVEQADRLAKSLLNNGYAAARIVIE